MAKDKKKLHVKPTKEELEAKTQEAVVEAEKLKETPKDEKPKEEPKLVIIKEDVPDKQVEDKEEPEETPEPVEEEETPEEIEIPKVPDYKKKFVASSREAQILHAENKRINETLDKAMSLPDPTEEEVQKDYPDWDLMGDFEKKMARDSAANKKRMMLLAEMAAVNKDLEGWQEEVDSFIDDPNTLINNPRLEGKKDDFRLFATRHQGTDFKLLVSAFLFDAESKKPQPKKGKMFETGSGGPNEKVKKSNKISLEEGRTLRKSDYKKWNELFRAGKIATE